VCTVGGSNAAGTSDEDAVAAAAGGGLQVKKSSVKRLLTGRELISIGLQPYKPARSVLPAGIYLPPPPVGWLGSRVVSVLDSGSEGPGFKSQSRRCRVTVLGKLFTPIVFLVTKQQNW